MQVIFTVAGERGEGKTTVTRVMLEAIKTALDKEWDIDNLEIDELNGFEACEFKLKRKKVAL